MDGYDRGNHTKYSLKVHLVFVTKYRKPIFHDPGRAENVKQFLYDVSKRYNYRIICMETETDHVHLLLAYGPNIRISDIVLHLKQYSTYQM